MTAGNGATDPHAHENTGSGKTGAFVSTINTRFGMTVETASLVLNDVSTAPSADLVSLAW